MFGLSADDISTVIVGVSLAFIALMGGQKGRQIAQGRSKKDDVVEVAGALVSDKAAAEWIKANDALSAGMTVMSRAVDRNTDAIETITDDLRDVKGKLSDVAKEMEIASRLHDRTVPPGRMR